MLGFDLSHLSAGEVKHLLAEQFQDDHVVLAEALARTTRSHDVADERGPVLWPLLLQDLEGKKCVNKKNSSTNGLCVLINTQSPLTHLHQDHIQLCQVNSLFLKQKSR